MSQTREPAARHPAIVLAVVLTASFMILLDISIVNVAIPSIQRNLNASYGQIQLVIAFYSLAYAVVLITGGRLGDIFGRKRLFIIGMTGFVLASAACGFAQSPEMLIASRVIQGVMAALMYPQVLSVIQVTFPVSRRGSAFAALGAVIGLATITGPILGGLLIQGNLFGLDWRPIFLVNLPVGIAAILGAVFLLHETRAPDAPHLDVPGVVIVSLGVGLLIYPLIEGRDAGWPLWAFVSMVAAVPCLAAFLCYERRRTLRHASPLVDTSLFEHRSFVAGLFVGMSVFAGIPAFFLTFTLLLQIGLGFTALQAGLTSFPFALGSVIASTASARLAPRLGRNILSVGSAVLALGGAGFILTLHLAGPGLQGWQLAPVLLVAGTGLGALRRPPHQHRAGRGPVAFSRVCLRRLHHRAAVRHRLRHRPCGGRPLRPDRRQCRQRQLQGRGQAEPAAGRAQPPAGGNRRCRPQLHRLLPRHRQRQRPDGDAPELQTGAAGTAARRARNRRPPARHFCPGRQRRPEARLPRLGQARDRL